MLSTDQIKKLEKLAKVGDVGIADELNVLEGKIEALEAIVPVLREAKDGEDGYTPVKGVDYFDGKDGYTPVKGVDYFDGVPGRDGRDGKDSTVPGPKGEKGDIGPQGVPGIDGKDGFVDEATVAYLEEEVKKAKLDTDAFSRALGIVDQRTSFLINKVNNLPTGSGVTSVVAGTNVTVDNTDPKNPIVSATVEGGSAVWGSIGGTLSAQTDLNSALSGKAASDHTHTGVYAPALGADDNYVTDAEKAALHSHSNKTVLDNTTASFTTADETKLDGIAAGAEVNVNADWNAVSGDAQILNKPTIPTQYTDEMAQDAVGGMVDTSLTYVDATPLLQRAALTGAITASAGSNTTALGSFTKAQLDGAVSDGNVLYVGDVTSNATHTGEVTGATALTVDKTAITNKTLVSAAVGDQILVADASDADNLKKVTVQTIVDLAAGGVSDGDKGDITVTGGVWNIDAGTIGTTELSATGTPSASTYLRGDNTWATPTAAVSSTAGVGATPTASGTVTITHGLGRTPAIIRIYSGGGFTANASATPTTYSMGIWNSSGNFCLYQGINGTTTLAATTSSTFAIYMITSAGNLITGVIQNVGATTFDIAFTETGTHTRGVYMWEAQ